jgi:hypothetical protein
MGERSQQATAAKQATTGKVYGAAVAYSAIIGFSFLFNKIALQVTGPVGKYPGSSLYSSLCGLARTRPAAKS